jgi:aerotaxis receptor
MRSNLPVTQTEIVLSDQSSIVSTTDLQGNITYANPYFVEVSGYEVRELLGAPQNILRHPDMPAEAFRDLWDTVKAGRPWTGMVKNRTKSGDFYWVLANVTPVYDDGQPVGYMSVRTRPNREQVQKADALYQQMREGNPRKLRIQDGSAVNGGLFTKLSRIGLVPRIQFSFLLVVLAFLAIGFQALVPDAVHASENFALGACGLGLCAVLYIALSLQGAI